MNKFIDYEILIFLCFYVVSKTFKINGSKIAFEIINKTDIKVQKVNKSGESLEGAAFRLEKLGDASFTPVEMGNESAISDFTFKCLDAGEYRLTEIKAPSNYIPLEEPILFTIIEESNSMATDTPSTPTA